TKEFFLLLLSCKLVKKCAALTRRKWIVIQGGTRFAEPAQPSRPLRSKLSFQFFAQPLRQRAAVAGGRNRNLQRTAANHGGIVEIAIGAIASHVAQDAS